MITFKSEHYGEVIMFAADARTLLGIIGKDVQADMGIITVEQIPAAINAIRAAVKRDMALQREAAHAMDVDTDMEQPVFLYQRAQPILQMLEQSLQNNDPVSWKE